MFSAIWNAASTWATGRDATDVPPTEEPPLHVRSYSSSALSSSPPHGPNLLWQESVGDAGFSEDLLVPQEWTGSASNRLFVQLLDDLDDLSSNSPSAHRRRRAREIFSEWLFSADLRSPAEPPAGFQRNDVHRRSNAAEYGPVLRTDVSPRVSDKALRRCSGDFSRVNEQHQKNVRHGPLLARRSLDERRQSEPLSLISSEMGNCKAQEEGFLHRSPSKRRWIFDSLKTYALFYSGVAVEESEPDSGYHTGSGNVVRYTPSERTLTREDLRRKITTFNHNNHGLIMEPPYGEETTFQGSIRVLMNLIRPISMCISVEPPTLYDVSARHDGGGGGDSMQLTSFYLPKDTTKVIHISSMTTSQEVIRVLLSKYHIMDNPRKFALYEKTSHPGKTVKLRRLSDDEMPLQICLSWTAETLDSLDHNQFVLQENDTGEILWEAFSLPELESFLSILNREEDEYIDQLRSKYRALRIHMEKRLQSFEAKAQNAAATATATGSSDKRTPVFV